MTRVATLTEMSGRQIATFSSDDQGEWPQLDLVDITGWFGGVGVKDNPPSRFRHGMFSEPTRFTGRDMTIYVRSKYETLEQRHILERGFSSLFASAEEYQLEVDIDGFKLHTVIQQDGEIDVAPENFDTLNFKIPVRSEDPFLYGEERQYQLFPRGFGDGIVYPLFSSGFLDYGTAQSGAGVPIRNEGKATAYPRIVVRGSWPSGFQLVSGRNVISFPSPVVSTAPVTIDTARGRATINGTDHTHALTRRDWFGVPPRGSIQPRISAIGQGDGWADVYVSDTYL